MQFHSSHSLNSNLIFREEGHGQQACYGEDENLIDTGLLRGGIVHWSYGRWVALAHFVRVRFAFMIGVRVLN